MPCYAVATAKALVSNKAFSQFMTKELLYQLINLVAEETGIEVRRSDYSHELWVSDLRFTDGGMLGVGYTKGDKDVTVAFSSQSPKAKIFMDALKLKIGTVGAALLNQKIAQILEAQGAQEVQTSFKPNGVAVTTFKA